MIDLIKKILGTRETEKDKKADNRNINLATCAILIEMANADGKFSAREKDNIINIFQKEYGLSEEEITGLMKSSEAELEKSIDLWQFTNLINQNYSIEEKLKVIEIIWKVAYSDGRLEKHEDYLIHKIAGLLRLSHDQLIDAKLKIVNGKQ